MNCNFLQVFYLLHTKWAVTTLHLFWLSFVAVAENLDSASQTKFTEDFIRKMEEWEQKKFGQYTSLLVHTGVILDTRVHGP